MFILSTTKNLQKNMGQTNKYGVADFQINRTILICLIKKNIQIRIKNIQLSSNDYRVALLTIKCT